MKSGFPMFILIILFIALFSMVNAQTTLSGNIGGMTLSPAGNPYVITDDIIVQEGKNTVVKAGTVFLFKAYTGLTVNGNLTVSGTSGEPVLFTSVNADTTVSGNKEMPNPFDWNGIKISADAGMVKLSDFEVCYSVYGIRSLKSDITIIDGIFRKNGQTNFTVKERMMPVVEAAPFSYSIALEAAAAPFSVTVRKLAVPVVLGTAGIGFGGAALYFRHRRTEIHTGYRTTTDQVVYDRVLDKESEALTRQVICAGASSVFLISATILYAVGIYRERTADRSGVSISPGPAVSGISVSLVLKIR